MATTPTNIKLPPSIVEALDGEAQRLGMTRSAVIREMLLDGLRARGLWPPPKKAA